MSKKNLFPIAIIAILCLVFVANYLQVWNYLIDDTFISMRYAKNLVDGHGLVYNQGDMVEGYTNFLWVILMTLFFISGNFFWCLIISVSSVSPDSTQLPSSLVRKSISWGSSNTQAAAFPLS